jgi:hypothetical protein
MLDNPDRSVNPDLSETPSTPPPYEPPPPIPDEAEWFTGNPENFEDRLEDFIDQHRDSEIIRYDLFSYSEQLLEWVVRYLINRRDAYGGYYRKDGLVCPKTHKSSLTRDKIIGHFRATCPNEVIGLHAAALVGDACLSRWVLVDIDRHADEDDPVANWRAAWSWRQRSAGLGFQPLLLDSNGRGGFHLWLIFDRPIPTQDAYRFGKWLVRDWDRFGLSRPPETFPKSPKIEPGGFGRWVRLFGRHPKRGHYTRVWDPSWPRWTSGGHAIRQILGTTGADPALIPPEALTFDITGGSAPRPEKPSGGGVVSALNPGPKASSRL